MDLATFSGVSQWILAHGYPLMLLAMIVEGPIVTAAAAFGAALGHFDITLVFLLSLLGDLIADIAYYGLGYWGRTALIEKYGRYIGLHPKKIAPLEKLLNNHSIKTLVAIKLVPGAAPTGLTVIGAIRMRFDKFATLCLLITLPKSIIFTVIGFYFGETYNSISRYIEYGNYFLALGIALFIITYLIYKKISRGMGEAMEDIEHL